jgi:hypothetical protein
MDLFSPVELPCDDPKPDANDGTIGGSTGLANEATVGGEMRAAMWQCHFIP